MSKNHIDKEDNHRPSKKAKGDDAEPEKKTVEPVTKAKFTVHEELEAGNYAGNYGGSNTCWIGLAGIRAGKDLTQYHTNRSPDEYFLESLDKLLREPHVQSRWKDVVMFDPLGLYATQPTMAATECHMTIPELQDKLVPDGGIVNENGNINAMKIAIDYAWDIPNLAKRLKMNEKEMRTALAKSTQNDRILNEKIKVFLPPVDGVTMYVIGDIYKLANPTTEVAVRVHDSCCGSDVFGTDICTCRPYLTFAIQAAVETAQRGGVGLIVYYRKEGRSLGEVTKYRVYNARKRQKGGDRPEMYFYQTEAIAGIRDARFQEAMPDVLVWLGIKRIDWLLSMSSDKYDAITGLGIEVMQRVSLPDVFVPAGAQVEITAKIASGYHTEKITALTDIISELRNLEQVRERCRRLYALAKAGKTKHFRLHLDKLPIVSKAVTDLTNKTYPDGNVPYHSRWRNFDEKEVSAMVKAWPCDKFESVRRQLDLVTVSVLLDAGAGPGWRYMDENGAKHQHSEGIAKASLDMFRNGVFSSDRALPFRVNSLGLRTLTQKDIQHGFQVSELNPMVGVDGRYGLLQRLGNALEARPEFFGKEVPRPGHIADYVMSHAKDGRVSIRTLWKAVIEGYESIWPMNSSGVRRGDVWVYTQLKEIGVPASDMIPFHKLSQWLTYSLLEPIESLGVKFDDINLLTGLAEYRNGGLLVDYGVLELKDPNAAQMGHNVGSELVVEWRALTVCLLDEVAELMRKELKKTKDELPLARVLQGGTWQAGRDVAKQRRKDGSPPIKTVSDGTVF